MGLALGSLFFLPRPGASSRSGLGSRFIATLNPCCLRDPSPDGLGLVALSTLGGPVSGRGLGMCLLSPLQLHVPLVAPARPSQFVHNNPFEARKSRSAAACVLSNLQVTSRMRLLLRDVLLFHLAHPSHSCGIPCLLPYVSGRTAARRGLIPAAKSLTNVSCLACASLWYSLPLEHLLPQKYSQLVLQPLPWAFVDRSYRSLSLDPSSWTSVPPPQHLISSLRRGCPLHPAHWCCSSEAVWEARGR